MKTKCYCVGCKLHPLHDKRKEFSWVTGWEPGRFIWANEQLKQGVDVNCLSPESEAFSHLWEDNPTKYEYPITAYDDGYAATGFELDGLVLNAHCEHEDHED
jgi:hypothetical protein